MIVAISPDLGEKYLDTVYDPAWVEPLLPLKVRCHCELTRRVSVAAAPTFYVVPGSTVKSVIEAHRSQIFEAVKAAYHFHASGIP